MRASSTPGTTAESRRLVLPGRRKGAMGVAGLIGLGLVAAAGAYFRLHPHAIPTVDSRWQDWTNLNRSPVATSVALVLNEMGQGILGFVVIPLAIAVCLWRRGSRAVIFFLVAEAVSWGAVQLLKHIVERSRPPHMVVQSDIGSFPSGHVANAATITVALILLFQYRWVTAISAIYTAAMALSRTYLHEHWLTDTVAGAILGAAVVLTLAAMFARSPSDGLTAEALKR